MYIFNMKAQSFHVNFHFVIRDDISWGGVATVSIMGHILPMAYWVARLHHQYYMYMYMYILHVHVDHAR